jgi:hypothetical protein
MVFEFIFQIYYYDAYDNNLQLRAILLSHEVHVHVPKKRYEKTALCLAKHRDAERGKSRRQKQRYVLLRISFIAFNSKQNLILRAILASSSSLCLSS